MAYLGKTPSQAVRQRYYFTAAGGETSLSGTDDNGNTLIYTDGAYADVYLNGVLLVAGTDYNTSTANTIGGLAALSASDVVEIVVYDVFAVFGGEVQGNFTVTNGTLTAEAVSVESLTTTGDITFGDDDKAIFGAGSDLQIYHDSNSSANVVTSELGSGTALYLFADDNAVLLRSKVTKAGVTINGPSDNYSVQLHHNGTGTKLETTSTGIDVTGTVTFDGGTTSADLNFGDNDKAIFGASNDLQIYANGGYSYIDEVGGQNLNIRTNGANIGIYDTTNSQYMARFTTGGDAELYYNGSEKLATTNTGIDVTGTVTADEADFTGQVTISTSTENALDILAGTNNQRLLRLSHPTSPADAGGYFDFNSDGTTDNNVLTFGVEYSGTDYDVLNIKRSTQYVGIGTTNPASELEISGADSNFISVTSTTYTNSEARLGSGTAGGYLDLFDQATGANTVKIRSYASSDVQAFFTAGNVGIGTSSPSSTLHISDSASQISIQGTAGTGTTHQIYTGGTNSQALNITSGSTSGNAIYHQSSSHIFRNQTGATEYARIDSSGNLLVSGTNTTPNTNSAGTTADNEMALRNDGLALFSAYKATANSGVVMDINRTSTDGDILGFRKNGSTVGSIGADGGDLYIGTGSHGIRFADGSSDIRPFATSTGFDTNGTTDLGTSGGAFRDLYLSGGVYLGGTGSANKLEDYEEGTWTPTWSTGYQAYSGVSAMTTNTAYYTKIGNLVHCLARIDLTTGASGDHREGSFDIGGLPFTHNDIYVDWSPTAGQGYSRGAINTSNGSHFTIHRAGSTTNTLRILFNGNSGGYASASGDAASMTDEINLEFVYRTTA